jgi:ribosome-associated protein
LDVNENLRVPDDEFQWSFVRAGGPGGQNVNKVASKAVLRWNVAASSSLPAEVKGRLRSLAQRRFTKQGELVLVSQRHRDQERNRQDCLDKLRELLVAALVVPKPRRPTKPSRGDREARLREKRYRSTRKVRRRLPEEGA